METPEKKERKKVCSFFLENLSLHTHEFIHNIVNTALCKYQSKQSISKRQNLIQRKEIDSLKKKKKSVNITGKSNF